VGQQTDLLLAAVGYGVGLGNVGCCCTGHRRVVVVSVRSLAGGWPVQRRSSVTEFNRAK
jgi:hypothetical protein